MSQANLRHVPSVEKVVAALGEIPEVPRPLVAEIVREEVARIRQALAAGAAPEAFESVVDRLRVKLASFARTRLQSVINGTGVIIHTNLGRAPLGADVADRLRDVAAGYCNLELDLDTGSRGERGQFVERALAVLCEAEAATVVNNCAAALVLVLRLLTRGEKKEVIVSRGELVEIGGGFRVPEILQSGGAVLREVGTTNRTSLADYEQAIGSKTAMILKVHRSNFFIDGFTQEPDVAELVTLVHQHGLPIVEDLGSGAVAATEQLNAGLEHEPTPAEALRHGIDLVCVSGDKLFGGPQAGIIAGKADWISKLKKDAIFRALRCDKLILAALEQTAIEYFNRDVGRSNLPVPGMLALATGDLRGRAERIVAALKVPASIGSGKSRCGGGTMPRSALDSITIDLRPEGMSVDEFGARLRHGRPPVIGHVSEGIFKIDLRTVFPWQDEALIEGIEAAVR